MDANVTDINAYRRQKEQGLQQELSAVEKKMNKRNRADTTTFVLMLSVAILYDVVQGALDTIPIVGWVLSFLVSIFAWLTFYVWTSVKGWGLSDSVKQFAVNWALPVVEIIPVLNALPAWTLKVVLSYSFLKAEDVLYNVTEGKADVEKMAEILKRAA